MQQGFCRLCLRFTELCVSHVIPNSYFKTMKREGNGKAVSFTTDRLSHVEKTQESWAEYLLCKDCEQKINRWETPCIDSLRTAQKKRSDIIPGYDYKTFSLCFLSLLWRAAESTHDSYGKIVLPSHHQKHYRAILAGEVAFDDPLFECRIQRLTDKAGLIPLERMVLSPVSDALPPSIRYTFFFGGYAIEFFVPKAPHKHRGKPGFLVDRSSLFVPTAEFSSFPDLMQSFVVGLDKSMRGMVKD